MKANWWTACAAAMLFAQPVSAEQALAPEVAELLAAAQKEGRVNSVGMPDTWANWKDTWNQLKEQYGIEHQDTDMSSAQEIAKFEAEKKNATADIGDVGASFGPIAAERGVTLAYKPTTWNDIPAWAKDEEGHWALAYTGTIAFIANRDLVKEMPRSWADLKNGSYKITLGDVGIAAQANSAVLAAAYALGGDEKNLQPAIDFFAELAKAKRLSLVDPSIANLEKGEVELAIMWDFNALGYADRIDRERFEVVIPSDGSLVSGYTTIINRYAAHPNAAKFAREYIFSDQGQINLARGYARPIRDNVNLPDDVKARLLPSEQYANARPVQNHAAWEETTAKLPRQWQSQVVSQMR